MKKNLLAGLALAALGALAPAHAIVIGSLNTPDDNCYPFGCAVGSGEYQQSYYYEKFSGPITISSIKVFGQHLPYWTNGTHVSAGTFTVSLSTSQKFGFPQEDNLGWDNTVVYSGSLGDVDAYGNLTLQLSKNFYYDPRTASDLLMDVKWTDATSALRPVYFLSDSGGLMRSQVGGDSGFLDYTGLVTEFKSAQVPEPASMALFGLGVLGIGLARRKAASS